MKKKRTVDIEKFLGGFVLVCFIIPVIIILIKLFTVKGNLFSLSSDYLLMMLQCIIGIIACFIPSIVTKQFRLEIPSLMTVIFLIFLYCAIFLGEVQFFYVTVKNWDTTMHTLSGIMIGMIGFSFVNILNENKADTHMKLSPFFVAFFAFCFSVMLGTLWELYEFAMDFFLGVNMLKTRLPDGTELSGLSAVGDTLTDLAVDMLGAFVAAVIGYISLRYKTGWLEKTLLRSMANDSAAEANTEEKNESESKEKRKNESEQHNI